MLEAKPLAASDDADRPDRPAPLFPGVVFAGVASLGGNCETAHWFRACGRYAVRGPFDWLVTPLDALRAILHDDGARLGRTFALANHGTSVRCRAYGVLYHHEFPRATGHAVVFDTAAIAACRSKLSHKWANLVAACRQAGADGVPFLFIRMGIGTDLAWDRLGPGKAPVAADVNAAAAAIAARFPGLDFRLLIVLPATAPGRSAPDGEFGASLDPRVALCTLSGASDRAWSTDGGAWGRLLSSVSFRDPPAGAVLGETLHWSGEAETAFIVPDLAVDPTTTLDAARKQPVGSVPALAGGCESLQCTSIHRPTADGLLGTL